MDAGNIDITTILTLLGSIIVAIGGYRKNKSDAEKASVEADNLLIQTALSLNKHELEQVRLINSELIERNRELGKEIEEKDSIIKELENKLLELHNLIQENVLEIKEDKKIIKELENKIKECFIKLEEKENKNNE